MVLWLADDLITTDVLMQILLLFGYAAIAASWLIFRTRRVLRSQIASGTDHDAQQE